MKSSREIKNKNKKQLNKWEEEGGGLGHIKYILFAVVIAVAVAVLGCGK